MSVLPSEPFELAQPPAYPGGADNRPSEAERVCAWRLERARRQGFRPAVAEEVAGESRLDLHDLDRLLGAGCRHELALRILR